MNEIIFSLCQKPIIGPIMFISSLCVFSPPIDSASVSLQKKGVILDKSFYAPVSKNYYVELNVNHSPEQAEAVRALLGNYHGQYCKSDTDMSKIPIEFKSKLGVQTPLEIAVYKESDNTTVIKTQVTGLCYSAHNRTWTMRMLVPVELSKGKYRLVVNNDNVLSSFANYSTSISITAGHGK